MAKRQIEYIIKADSKQAFAASTKLLKQAENMGNQIEQSANKGQKGFSDMGRTGAAALSKMTALITGAGGLLAAWKLITAEMDQQKGMQEESAQKLMTQTVADQALLRNLPGITGTGSGAIFKSLQSIADETTAPRAALTQAMAQAVSASGGNIAGSLDAVRAAGKFMPEVPGEIPQFAGSLLDIQKLPGVNDAMTALGVLQYVGAQSRVVDPGLQARNIPGALIGMGKAGATPEEAAEMFAFLTTQAADVKGEPSRTAGVNFAVKIRDFFKAQGIEGADTMGGRISHLQGKPELAEEFLKGLGGEVRYKPIFEELFKAGTVGQRAYRDIAETIPGVSAMAPAGLEAIRRRRFAPGEPVDELDRGLQVLTDKLAVEDIPSALGGVLRKRMKPLWPRLGKSAIGAKFKEIQFEGMTMGGTWDALEGIRQMVLSEQKGIYGRGDIQGAPVGRRPWDIELFNKTFDINPMSDVTKYPLKLTGKQELHAGSLGKVDRLLMDAIKLLGDINKNTKGKETFDKPENK